MKESMFALEAKLETAIEAKLVQGMVKSKSLWPEVIVKEVQNKYMELTIDVTHVKEVLEKTRKIASKDKDREARANNIIIYWAPESLNIEDSKKYDKVFCMELFTSIPNVDIEEAMVLGM